MCTGHTTVKHPGGGGGGEGEELAWGHPTLQYVTFYRIN